MLATDLRSENAKLRETIRQQNERIADLEMRLKNHETPKPAKHVSSAKQTTEIDKPFKPA